MRFPRIRLLTALGLMLALALPQALPAAVATPAQLYGELYRRVEMQHCYPDSKTFADAVALAPAPEILAAFAKQDPKDCAALQAFAQGRFALPQDAAAPAAPAQQVSLGQHIANLWPQLVHEPAPAVAGSSQLPFAFRHVVPGGRFREIYYWDTYFTLLGLKLDGHGDMAQAMVDGFADLIARYGHVPNGTRSYYLSRSQPPFFYMMVGLLTPQKPELAYGHYLAALKREHAFWMEGEQGLKAGAAAQHVVKLADGSLLNRYWDASDAPRDESYREDVELAQQTGRGAELYREIRSAAESGWDFSSRWFGDGKTLATIETTSIVPVDLNALLFGLERAIAQGCAAQKDADCAVAYGQRAAARRVAMNKYLWNAQAGAYLDWQWRKGAATGRLSAATLYPLFTGVADEQQAAAVAKTARAQLLRKGGLATTTAKTGQQWDEPNGWPPLQWIAVKGLRAYGERVLANEIAQRWLDTVQILYAEKGKLVEKYDVDTQAPGSGGEYPTQDGFGWTNGVTRALMQPEGEMQ